MSILRRFFQIFKSIPVLLFSAALGAVLLLGTSGLVYAGISAQPPSGRPTALVTAIPGPTSTAFNPTPTAGPQLTPTSDLPPSPMPGVIGVGSYVQISGTEGSGLNIRSAPGLDATVNFLALDAEVFEVREGPNEIDGITWWFLVTPVDEVRSGWAAANYLTVVDPPNN